ncbi:Ribosome-binding factor A [bacterium HR35]|nr:Ribosome-binding factor A [bacterium HR35]
MKERKKYEIIKVLSEILEKFNIFENVVFTLVDVKLPKKGGYLKVFLSIFPESKAKQLISFFQKNEKSIRKELKENVYLRHLPAKIVFYQSFEFKEAEKVYRLLNKIKLGEK